MAPTGSKQVKNLPSVSKTKIVVAQSLIHLVTDSATLWTGAQQASLSRTVSWGLLKFMSIES